MAVFLISSISDTSTPINARPSIRTSCAESQNKTNKKKTGITRLLMVNDSYIAAAAAITFDYYIIYVLVCCCRGRID
jgi:hypothetical protein